MENFEKKWQAVAEFFKQKFTSGEEPQLDTILFLIGIQEYGIIQTGFSKDDKLNLMHIATCKLLEPYGYYEFSHRDDAGWPHYKRIKPVEKSINQEQLIKEVIINYFDENDLL
jgi:hypothetical protein